MKILCVGAHSDDIEIGCGGTMLRLLTDYPAAEVHWVVLGSSGARDGEATASAREFLAGAQQKTIAVEHFRDGFFPDQWAQIKECFEEIKRGFSPDLIFTHYRGDRHQDHRVVSDLTWNTFRDNLVLEYEIMKYDGDLGNPNLFVALDHGTCRAKVAALLRHFRSQAQHTWFTQDTFMAMMRLRGVECNAHDGHAEAFYCRKAVL
jgi:LmbE family N-acetylglucosaminyl deacetylase